MANKFFTDRQHNITSTLQSIAFIIESGDSNAEKQAKMVELLNENQLADDVIFSFIGQGVKHLDGDLHLDTLVGNIIEWFESENIKYKVGDLIKSNELHFHAELTTAYPIIKLYSETNGKGYDFEAEELEDFYGENYEKYTEYITEIGIKVCIR